MTTSNLGHNILSPPTSIPALDDEDTASSSPALAWHLLILFALAHIPLALIVREYRIISTFHALLTLAIGIYYAITPRYQERVLLIAGYIAGAEVFWRMTKASVFWEYGKYAIIAVLGYSVLRRLQTSKIPWLPLFYFVLLLPSLTLLVGQTLSYAREQISFTLAAHLLLLVSATYFANRKTSLAQLQTFLFTMTVPILSILTLATSSTFQTQSIIFTLDSNILTSGGYGPNQVSSLLGLGAANLLFLMITRRVPRHLLPLLVGLCLWLFSQTALTFSRGGVYGFLICVGIIGLHYLRDQRSRFFWLAILGSFTLVFMGALFPYLNEFTNQTMGQRLMDLNTTGRQELVQSQLAIWGEHPFRGVGPGQSNVAGRAIFGHGIATHTEYARLLAEHGLFGLVALFILLFAPIRNLLRIKSSGHRVLIAMLTAWALFTMLHAATRIAAPTLFLGMSWLQFSREETNE